MKDRGFVEIQTDYINPNISGFHWRSHGRGVNIYFVEDQADKNKGIEPISSTPFCILMSTSFELVL